MAGESGFRAELPSMLGREGVHLSLVLGCSEFGGPPEQPPRYHLPMVGIRVVLNLRVCLPSVKCWKHGCLRHLVGMQ